jgi:chromosomal replication initiator protein
MEHIWRQVKAELSEQIPQQSFRMWIDPLKLEHTDDNCVKLTCPNRFFQKRITENFGKTIRAELRKVSGRPVRLDILVAPATEPEKTAALLPQQMAMPGMAVQSQDGKLLRDEFTFDQFVVGQNNAFAYSAALSLAAQKKAQLNALFLLSGIGMGKSHLSHAVGHQILAQSPRDRVYYMTAEDFTNEMVTSFKTNSVDAFKNKYHRNCDVLLLEDVQYLSGKQRTQIELANTLDALFNDNKKIIFSGCCAPADIPKLNERLRSRLTGGLISSIEPPQYSTRLKILKQHATEKKWSVAKPVFEYLASELTRDVRQLKNGLLGVVSKASLMGQPLDIGLAAGVVKTMVKKQQSITTGSITKLVCKHYNLTHKELVSRSRKRSIVQPRQVAIYLTRKYTDQSLKAIGNSFNRYHATVLHAIGAVEKGIRRGGAFQGQVEYLTQKLEAGDD